MVTNRAMALLLVLAAACAPSPDAVVSQAGHAIMTRDRAAFYDAVDLDKIAQSIDLRLTASLRDEVDRLMKLPADTSTSGTVTARALLSRSVHSVRVGALSQSHNVAFVPLNIGIGEEDLPTELRLRLDKENGRWKITGVEGLTAFSALEDQMKLMKADLRNLMSMQEAFFADNSYYTQDLGPLTPRSSPGVTVQIDSATPSSWFATATMPFRAPSLTCQLAVRTGHPAIPVCKSSSRASTASQ